MAGAAVVASRQPLRRAPEHVDEHAPERRLLVAAVLVAELVHNVEDAAKQLLGHEGHEGRLAGGLHFAVARQNERHPLTQLLVGGRQDRKYTPLRHWRAALPHSQSTFRRLRRKVAGDR